MFPELRPIHDWQRGSARHSSSHSCHLPLPPFPWCKYADLRVIAGYWSTLEHLGGGGAEGGGVVVAESTGSHCGGTALCSDRRAWAVELGADKILGLMVLVTVAPARTQPCASWKKA